jgi:tRNA (Uracil-5-)-methyltransferase
VWEAAARGARTRLTAALQRSSEGSSSSSSGSTLHVIGRSRKQKIVLGADYVTEQMTVAGRVLQYRQARAARPLDGKRRKGQGEGEGERERERERGTYCCMLSV